MLPGTANRAVPAIRPVRRVSWAAMIIAAVLPAPTPWAISTPRSAEARIRHTTSFWCGRGGEVGGEAGQGEVGAVPLLGPVPVEQPVVAAGEPGGPFGFGPAPHLQRFGEVVPAQLLRRGRFGVDDGDLAVADLLLDVHGDRLGVARPDDLFGHRVAVGAEPAPARQVPTRRRTRCPVGGWYLTVMSPPSWSAMNAAMSSGSSHVTPNSGVISAAVSGVGCTARRASTLRSNRAIGRRGGERLVELPDDVTGEVVGGEVPLPYRRLERHLGQLRLGGRGVDAELVGDVAGVDAVPAGERVGDGLLDRVGPIRPHLPGGLDDRALQDRRRGRLAGVVVEHFEGGDGPPRRVGAEPLQLRVAPPDLGPLPGRVVDGVVVVVGVAALDRLDLDEVVGVERPS